MLATRMSWTQTIYVVLIAYSTNVIRNNFVIIVKLKCVSSPYVQAVNGMQVNVAVYWQCYGGQRLLY